MKAELIICLFSLLVFLSVFIFYMIKIHSIKKTLSKKLKEPGILKADGHYVWSVIFCFMVMLLPFIVPLRIFVIIVCELCAVFGQIVVFKERIEILRKSELDT